MPPETLLRGWSVRALAKYLRVGRDTVLGWISRGELRAHNVARHRSSKAHFVVLQPALDAFLAGREVAPRRRDTRPRRRATCKDYYPGVE